MIRYYDWHITKTPDFWKVYYGQPELIKLLAYANSIEASRTAGYKYLQAYDVMSLEEYLPGNVIVWEPLAVSSVTQLQNEYWGYAYTIPVNWLTIDTISERYVDPTIVLQNKIDFVLEDGLLKTKVALPDTQLFVVKGTVTGTRIDKDFGRIFGYSRYDSYPYRDNFGPLLSLMYNGASIPNVVGAINVAYKQPVSKYSGEYVLESSASKVVTNKYSYGIKGSQVIVAPGQYLSRYSPLTRVADFHSYQHAIDFSTGVISQTTRNNWWVDKPTELFQKYTNTKLTQASRDYMMEQYLKNFVAYLVVRFDPAEEGTRYDLVNDIKAVLFDGLPVRTDLIVSQAMSIHFDPPEVPNDWNALAIGTMDVWAGLVDKVLYGRNMLVEPFTPSYTYGETYMPRVPGSSMVLTAQEHIAHRVYSDSEYDRLQNTTGLKRVKSDGLEYEVQYTEEGYKALKANGEQYSPSEELTYSGDVRWAVGSHRYRILPYEQQEFNGWSIQDSIPPYLDLNYDYVYFDSYVDSSRIPYYSKVIRQNEDLNTYQCIDSVAVRGLDLVTPTSLDDLDTSTLNYSGFKRRHYYTATDLFGWASLNGRLMYTSDRRIICKDGHADSLTMPVTRRIPLGHMAAIIGITQVSSGNLELWYRIDSGVWVKVSGSNISVQAAQELSTQRYLQLRYVFDATETGSPILDSIALDIQVLGGQ